MKKQSLFLLLTILMLPAADLFAQRISYESLRQRERQPNVFWEYHVLPESGETMSLVNTFRLEKTFLSFRRYRGDDADENQRQFYSEPRIEFNIHKTGNRPGDTVSDSLVSTLPWRETIYAETYEQTQSTTSFVEDMVRTSVESGRYRVSFSARANSRSRRDRTPGVLVPSPGDTDIALFYFLDEATEADAPFEAPLMNMGDNVYFGRDHQLVIWFPGIRPDTGYRLEIHKLQINRQDTTVRDKVWEKNIDRDELLTGYLPGIRQKDNRPHFRLSESENDDHNGTYYLTKVPNSTFENAKYRIRLVKKPESGEEKIIARRTYQSLWLDMPVSLLNLDVATQMMRFIVDDDKLRSMRRGSSEEREQKFREFWKERDPSPDKEYNELMVEYYRRIDYAFDNFTSPQNPGYESDRGKVYIRNGEPENRERIYPPNQPTREIWHYNGRTFVFEATTGFGDYQLIEQR